MSLQSEEENEPVLKVVYIPKPITDEDVIHTKKIPIGENFDDWSTKPQITYHGKRKIKPIESIDEGNFHELINLNLRESNITKLTPVQKYAIPAIYGGDDLVVLSPTGTGKTSAYLLPILSNLLKNVDSSSKSPFALIVVPTHELGIQVVIDAKRLLLHSKVDVKVVYGGTEVKHQIEEMQEGCHILVATPGRLHHFVDLRVRGQDGSLNNLIDLSNCRYVVLDEFDQLMEKSFIYDVREVLVKFYYCDQTQPRQTLMFSATMLESRRQTLMKVFLFDPSIKYASLVFDKLGQANRDIDQVIEKMPKSKERIDRLVELLQKDIGSCDRDENNNFATKTLVFINRKKDIDKISALLDNEEIPHGKFFNTRKNQEERELTLKQFRNGEFPILLATSLASRGLDIVGVDHVINYDLPQSSDDYIHRIGRTGRIGNRGRATSFFDLNHPADTKFAPFLVKILADALQIVPEWLQRFGESVSSYEFW